MKKRVIAHLKGDIKGFKKEAAEDKKLIKALKHEKKESKKHEKAEHKKKHAKKKHVKKGHKKFEKVLKEFKSGKLHSGSKKGPKVKSKSQALAIAYSEDRRANKTAKGGK